MAKQNRSATVPAVTAIAAGETSDEVLRNIRVIDTKTGDEIARVISADTEAGTVTRFLIEDGNLVRNGDAFETVTEERPIKIEWIDPPKADGDGSEQSDADPADHTEVRA